MLEYVSAGECKGRWADHSHLRLNFGTLFLLGNFPLLELSSSLWVDLSTKRFYLFTTKADGWVGQLVGALEGEGGAD